MQLTSSKIAASTGDIVKFTLTNPSFASNTILDARIKIYEPYNDVNEYKMTKLNNSVYEFDYEVAGETSGSLFIRADAFTVKENVSQKDFLISNFLEMTITPKMDELCGMEVTPFSVIVMYEGGEEQVNVLGAFNDGHTRLINEGYMGTTYEITGDPEIAVINEDGVMKALKEGRGTLVVRNGNISTTATIKIREALDFDSDTDSDSKDGCNSTENCALMLSAFPFLIRRKK